ncbi:MAG: ABC transporter permease, partial [Planctomycetes bacterium]|nr:ABC transporter permease [Planctomycetota bacterium]
IALTHALLKIFAGSKIRPAVSIAALAWRNSLRRRGRSLAVVTMLACGVFIVIAVGANKHDPSASLQTRQSGTGGFDLMGESAIGVLYDLNSKSGRKSVGLDANETEDTEIVQLRVRDGDDASCFNLNRAQQPRLLGIDPKKLQQRKTFSFTRTIEENKSAGWNLLDLNLGDDVVAAIGDEATIKWGLGKSVGDEIVYSNDNGKRFRVRLVAMLKNSILQGSLLIAEEDFIRHFPTEAGYRLFLVDTPAEKAKSISETLSTRLKDYGLEVTTTAQKLSAFSAVENSYLSIFQLLGSFGLILGSVGLGVVVGRNVLDRTGEFAMLRAIGFNRKALKLMVFYEHVGLMFFGLFLGSITALIAIFPVLKESVTEVPYLSLILSIMSIAVSGVIWIWIGTSIALSGKIIDGLRRE